MSWLLVNSYFRGQVLFDMEFSLTKEEERDALASYTQFLKQPSISATGEGIMETADLLNSLFQQAGIQTAIRKTEGHPIVTGEYNTGAARTILVYNHYDVQPVDPLNEWHHGPFSADIANGRVYARGAADNKGTLIARLLGFKKFVEEKAAGLNFKFLVEGEEEIGSPHLERFIRDNAMGLHADSVIMEGGGLDAKGRPQIILGVKGLLYLQLDTSIGERDLHSSNAVITENAAWKLLNVLSTIRGSDGQVLVPGFYDDVKPLREEYLSMVDTYDIDPSDLERSLGVSRLTKKTRKEVALALFNEPSCNIDGLASGYSGAGAKTIVPARASAKMDFRLVPDQDPQKILQLLRNHLAKVGFEGDVKVLSSEFPVRSSSNTVLVSALKNSAAKVYGRESCLIPNSPGTQPMSLFTHVLGIGEAVSAIGAGGPMSAVHAPNENVEIDHFYKAILHSAQFFYEYALANSGPSSLEK